MTAFLENNHKFAFLVIPQTHVGQDFQDILELDNGIYIFRNPPFELDKMWKNQLGEFTRRDLEEADLLIGTKLLSTNPMVQGKETKILEIRVNHFLLALKISGFFRCDKSPWIISGAHVENSTHIRGLTPLLPVLKIQGIPIEHIGLKRLKRTSQIHSALIEIYNNTNQCSRIKRALEAFRVGLSIESGDEKLHRFVRCIEGFIYPEEGKTRKQFKSRTELFIGSRHHELMDLIYRMRSKVEHLHDALECLTEQIPLQEKISKATKNTILTESIARYCLSHFLLSKDLWTYFIDDESIKTYWKLDPKERETIWGNQLDLSITEKSIGKELK